MPAGHITLVHQRVFYISNEAEQVCSPFSTVFELSSIAPMERYALFFGLQGGGVFVDSNGVANFESCNIHDNTVARKMIIHEEFEDFCVSVLSF